ncbi:kinase-like domain-containing protein [Trametes gibbosa]|nr:kinase-like domain-containing protein [Trametes gibbosa]
MSSSADWIPEFLGHTINDGRLRLVEVLGEGAYGVVFRAIAESGDTPSSSSSPPPQQYAVKIIEKAKPHTRRWRYQQREVAAQLIVADHPNIVTVHDAYECEYFIYIVLDFCAGGDLFNPMIERHIYARNDALLKSVFLQLLDAVQYCHEHGLYHRDLKPDNIMTNEDGTEIKLGDFGLVTTAKVSDTFGCGSSNYMSPECLGEDYDYHPFSTEASDVWSLGVILTNLVAGRNPWDVATTKDKHYLQYLAYPGYLRTMLPISEETESILYEIFSSDPTTRITLPELRERILAVESFTMTDEEVASSGRHVKNAAASYFPAPSASTTAPEPKATQKEVFSVETDVRKLLRGKTLTSRSRSPAGTQSMFVICPSTGISSDSSSADSKDSKGPITPKARAQDQAKLVEVPDLKETEKIGAAVMLPDIRKGQSLPVPTNIGPLVVTIALL